MAFDACDRPFCGDASTRVASTAHGLRIADRDPQTYVDDIENQPSRRPKGQDAQQRAMKRWTR
jgi:hypothetical protein